MCILKIFFVACMMLVASQAEEKSRCEIEHNMTDADMEDLRKLNMSDKLNCFSKCAMRASESINNEGEINVEKLNQAVNRWMKVTEEENKKLNECFGTLAPVKVCSDVKHIIECVKNRKHFHGFVEYMMKGYFSGVDEGLTWT